jgi:hypothetical protein
LRPCDGREGRCSRCYGMAMVRPSFLDGMTGQPIWSLQWRTHSAPARCGSSRDDTRGMTAQRANRPLTDSHASRRVAFKLGAFSADLNRPLIRDGAPGEIRTHDLCLRRIGVRVSGPLCMRFFDPRRRGTQRQHHAITRTLCGRFPMLYLSGFRGLCCKTIFATKRSNIDSRTSTAAQHRFKTVLRRIR